jgi:hypothetical protein
MAGNNGKPSGAFDPVEHVIRRLREQRLRWVELGEGRAVQVLVLRETEVGRLRPGAHVDVVCEQAVDWRGFTEAALFGAHDGSSDLLPFTPELWAAVARDSMAYVDKVLALLVEEARLSMERAAAAKKA